MEKALVVYRRTGIWWFRVFGYGIHGRRIIHVDYLIYSDKAGLVDGSRIVMFGWMFKWLKPERRKDEKGI